MKSKFQSVVSKNIILPVLGKKRAIKLYYYIKTKNHVDFDNPTKFTEKIQVRKYRECDNLLFAKCADKVAVRDYVKEKIGEQYLIPIYFVKEKIEISDLEKLPNSFVLKTNNASKSNIIVFDKEKEDMNEIVDKMNKYVEIEFGYNTFELFYNHIKPLILAEKLLGDSNENIPNDYKFHCFKQKDDSFIIIIQVDHGRYAHHIRAYFNENWEMQTYGNSMDINGYDFEKPKTFDEMISIAKTFAADFDYVRVDLYEFEEKVYFGELTFTDGSGYELFDQPGVDEIWSNYWIMRK